MRRRQRLPDYFGGFSFTFFVNRFNSGGTSLELELQVEGDFEALPSQKLFILWIEASLRRQCRKLEQSIRIVDEAESQQLNRDFRGKDKPTNVLSFPADDTGFLPYDYLGDLVICAPVVEREAREQGKERIAHWAHMVVHGMLHLQGYDHEDDAQAAIMEALEIEILGMLGHTNPYLNDERP